MALALFAGGLIQINLVGPLREYLAQTPASRLALPVRLYPNGTGRDDAPDLTLTFPFTVHGIDPDAGEELDEVEEDFEENNPNQQN